MVILLHISANNSKSMLDVWATFYDKKQLVLTHDVTEQKSIGVF